MDGAAHNPLSEPHALELEHAAARRYRRRGIWVMLVVSLLLLAVVPALFVVLWSWNNTREVDAELARLREAGEPVTAADLEAMYRLPEGADDVTDLILTAIGPLEGKEFKEALDALPDWETDDAERKIPPPGEAWPRQAEVELFLSQYATQLSQLHEAARRGGAARFPTDFRLGIDMDLPHLNRIRHAARILQLEACARAHQGDAHGTAQSIHALFVLARSLEYEPLWASQMRRNSVAIMARITVEELLPHVPFGDEDLALLQRDLLGIRFRDALLVRAVQGERVVALLAFDEVVDDPSKLDQDLADWHGSMLWRWYVMDDKRMYLTLMGRYQEAALVPRTMPTKINAMYDKYDGAYFHKKRFLMTKTMLIDVAGLLTADLRETARNRAAAVAIALVQYRRRHGRRSCLPLSGKN
jgi:hypothetical protein